jgi:hypothetical protein
MTVVAAPASSVARQALDHVLDANSVNQQQHRILFNPTREVDSLSEWIISLPLPVEKRREGLRFVRQLMDLNVAEGIAEREAAGLLEPVSIGRQLRAQGFTCKQIAVRLRRPLREGGSYIDAVRAVRGELRTVGETKLRGAGLAGELGAGPTKRLNDILDHLQSGGAR